MPPKEYSLRKKLKANDRLQAKKDTGAIVSTSEDVSAIVRDKDLRQEHEKTALLRLADQFFALQGRSLEQVAYDEARVYNSVSPYIVLILTVWYRAECRQYTATVPLEPSFARVPSPIKMQLEVNYLHKHSFAPSGASSSTLQQELADAEIAIHQKRPGQLVSTKTPSFPLFRNAALEGIPPQNNTVVPI